MKNYLLFFLSLVSLAALQAQDLRGGEYRFIRNEMNLNFEIEVTLYFETTEEPGLDTISVWAEDVKYTAPLVEVRPLSRGIEAYLYHTSIFLAGAGQHSIFIDPTLPLVAENVVEDSLFWPLYCDLDITPYTLPPFDTTLAVWEPFDFNYSINENDELKLKMRGYDPDGDGTVGYWESTWLNFLYNHGEIDLLAPPDNFSFDPYTGDFIWGNPPGPGRYLLGFDLIGVTADLQNPNNRFSRYLIIELTEEDFMLNTSTRAVTLTELNIYPNPTTTTTTLEYGGLSGEIQLKAINAQGQVLLQKTLNGTAQLQREVIDVSTWPAGVYWIELSNEAGQVTKRLVVE